MSTTHLFTAVVEMLLLWLSISVHEAAHAWVAERCGDATPRLLGRVSLNPLRHLDVLGSVLLPLLLVIPQLPVFGWGRRPYWVTRNLRRPYWHSLLVNAAGPAANLLLAALAVVALGIAAPLLGDEARQAAMATVTSPVGPIDAARARLAGFPVMFTLVRLSTLNVYLAAFNLLPVPPLDGGQIALQLLPADWAAKLAGMRLSGFIIGIALAVAFVGVVTLLLVPIYWMILHLVINFL
jgi:Zn-dependent protease